MGCSGDQSRWLVALCHNETCDQAASVKQMNVTQVHCRGASRTQHRFRRVVKAVYMVYESTVNDSSSTDVSSKWLRCPGLVQSFPRRNE
jgi:hypothetical protein